jgi:hypothetical protein
MASLWTGCDRQHYEVRLPVIDDDDGESLKSCAGGWTKIARFLSWRIIMLLSCRRGLT